MSPELITALLRATNDGVIPSPTPGEDTYDYRLRAAMAGAAVTLAHLRDIAAAKAARDAGDVLHPDGTSPGRPQDVPGTSLQDQDAVVEIGVD